MSKLVKILVLSTLMSICVLQPLSAQDAAIKAEDARPPKIITVRTVTDQGANIRASVRVRMFPKEEADAYVKTEGNGYKVVVLERCDDTVSLKAFTDTFGITRKQGDLVEDWLPCKEPEVVFNDFVISDFDIAPVKKAFSDPIFWDNAFGSNNSVVNVALSKDIADAFANQQYGKISIIGSELHQQFKAAGKQSEADFFYSLAVDAAAKGVLQVADGGPPSLVDRTEYLTSTGRFELSPEAKALLEKYQQDKLGIAPGSEGFGKVGWLTMKSLAGGETARVAEYKLDPGQIAVFNAEDFLKDALKPQM
jgi:hypothetical protein